MSKHNVKASKSRPAARAVKRGTPGAAPRPAQAASEREITISASAFKANCLSLFKRLEQGRLRRVTVTRRGTPVADVAARASKPRRRSFDDVFGAMRGTITIAPGVNLVAPTEAPDDWDAERGAPVNGEA
jgi:antitoxin (DNA-binding transcriptional repressor) of toxin-antitoxin stability system